MLRRNNTNDQLTNQLNPSNTLQATDADIAELLERVPEVRAVLEAIIWKRLYHQVAQQQNASDE